MTSVRESLVWNYRSVLISRSFIIGRFGRAWSLSSSFILEVWTFWNITISISLMFFNRETICITPWSTRIIILTRLSNSFSSALWLAENWWALIGWEKSFGKPDWISTVVWIKSVFWIMTNSIWKISVPTLTRDTPNLLRDGPRIWTVRTPTTVTCPCYGQK